MRLPRHLLVAGSGWAARLVTMGVQLASIPLLTTHLGTESFAAYALVLSLAGWFALFDVGTGTAVQNFAAEARATSNSVAPEIGAVALLLLVSTVLGAVLMVSFAPAIAHALFTNVVSLESSKGIKIVETAAILFLLTNLGTVTHRLLYGLGYGVLANILVAMASLFSLAALLIVTNFLTTENPLLSAIAAYALPSATLGLIAALKFFLRHGTFRLDGVIEALTRVWRRAKGFWLIAFFATCVLNIDYMIMSQTLSATDIAIYAVLARCFGVVLGLYSGLLNATAVYWSECIARNEWHSVQTSWRSHIFAGALLVIIFTLLLYVGKGWLLDYLLPGNKSNGIAVTILLFGAYSLIRVWTDASTVVLQAANETRPLISWIPAQALVGIIAQLLLVPLYGVQGTLVGLSVSFIVTVCWALPRRVGQISHKSLKKL